MIGGGCFIDSAVIGDGAVIGEGVKIEKGAVVGPYSVLGDRCLVGQGAFVSEGQVVKSGEILQDPLYNKDLFSRGGIFLSSPEERTVYSLGAVIRKCMVGKKIAVCYDESVANSKVRSVFTLGLCTAEGSTFDIGKGFSSLASFASRTERYDLTVFITQEAGGVFFKFYDCDGLYPGAVFESKVRHSSVCISSMNVPKPVHCLKIQSGVREKYMDNLS